MQNILASTAVMYWHDLDISGSLPDAVHDEVTWPHEAAAAQQLPKCTMHMTIEVVTWLMLMCLFTCSSCVLAAVALWQVGSAAGCPWFIPPSAGHKRGGCQPRLVQVRRG